MPIIKITLSLVCCSREETDFIIIGISSINDRILSDYPVEGRVITAERNFLDLIPQRLYTVYMLPDGKLKTGGSNNSKTIVDEDGNIEIIIQLCYRI